MTRGLPHGYRGPAYASLNLRRNPFGALDPAERAEVAVAELEPWATAVEERLSTEGGGRLVVQLVGHPGAGKTTHLAALGRRFPGAARIAWSRSDGWGALPPGRLLLVDDGHRMPGRLLRSALRRDVVVIATHHDLGRRVRRRGTEVLTVHVPRHTDRERVEDIARRRIEWARRGEGPVPTVPRELVSELVERHGGDLRRMVSHLYDHIEDLREDR